MRRWMILAWLLIATLYGCKQTSQTDQKESSESSENSDLLQQPTPDPAEPAYVSRFDSHATEQLRSFVESACQAFKIPGIAIGILDHDQIVFREGFGSTDAEDGKPVTAQTLFNLGHVSKAVSGYMMAGLVHDGVFGWDTPMTVLMPDFETASPELTQNLTIADALCDCAGIPGSLMAAYFTYENDNYGKAFARIRKATGQPQPAARNWRFQRSRNNALFALGCYAAAQRVYPDLPSAEAFRRLISERVLEPLGMNATTYTPDNAVIAQPFGVALDETVRRIDCAPDRQISQLEPAYGLWSNVDDMLKLLKAELDSQVPENLERRKVRAMRDENRGMGIAMRMQHRRDQNVLMFQNDHVGYAAMIFMIPEQKLAAVILANARFARFYLDLISAKIFDIAFDQSSAAWLLEEATHKYQAAQQTVARMIGKFWLIEPDHAWYKQFIGSYHDDVLGRITITDNGSDIVLDAGEWRTRLGVRVNQSGTKSMLFIDPPLAGITLTPVFEKNKLKALELQEPHVTYMFVPETTKK